MTICIKMFYLQIDSKLNQKFLKNTKNKLNSPLTFFHKTSKKKVVQREEVLSNQETLYNHKKKAEKKHHNPIKKTLNQ